MDGITQDSTTAGQQDGINSSGKLWLDEEESLEFDFEHTLALPSDDATLNPDDPDAKKDFKRGTVVCRHWLRGLCMKGESCEFLHQYDMSKMPECRWGMECQVPECPFRHVPDEDRMECAFYKQGFCSHGAGCRYRHVKLPKGECPAIADFNLQSKVADEESAKRRKAQPVNEFFKIAICKHWEKLGSCPFGDECHFAHGEKELRPFPKGEKDAPGGGGPSGSVSGGKYNPNAPSGMNGAVPAQVPEIILPDDQGESAYIVLRSHSYQNLAQSVHHQQWSCAASVLRTIHEAMTMVDQVFVYFTVSSSTHFQGVAKITQMPQEEEGVPLDMETVLYSDSNGWKGMFSLEWLRTCELQYETADTIREEQSFISQVLVNLKKYDTFIIQC